MKDAATELETKRDQIIDAARIEFVENGFAAASMDRISARACASKRTVYRYFDSKETLFRTMVEQHWNQLVKSLEFTYDPMRGIREQLIELGHAEGRILTSPETMATTKMVMSEILRAPELAGKAQEKTDFRASFEHVMREAAANGQLDLNDPGEAADEFIGLIKAKAFWPVIMGAPILTVDEMTRVVDNSVEMIMCRYSPD